MSVSAASDIPPSPIHGLLGARQGELGSALPAVLMGFLLFGGYSLMKPLRDASNAVIADRLGDIGVARVTTATLAAMALATIVAAGAVTLLRWKRFFVLVQLVWLGGAVAFAVAFAADPTVLDKGARADWLLPAAFVVCVNVFNLLSLSFMWSRMSDLFLPEQAKRLYPLVGMGITLGGIAGSASVAQWGRGVPLAAWLAISAAALLLSTLVAAYLTTRPDAPRDGPQEAPVADAGAVLKGAAEGVAALIRSPYLMALCAYLFLYTTTGTIIWFEQQRIVRAAAESGLDRAELSARIDLWTNIVTLTLQGMVAGRIIAWMGVGRALLVTPVTTAIGVVVLLHAPQLLPLILVQVGRRGLHFAIDRPARESLYTVLSRAERHKAKGFIDTFVYRLGDQAGAYLQATLGAAGPAVVYLTAGACVVWGGLGLWLGRAMGRQGEGGSGRRET